MPRWAQIANSDVLSDGVHHFGLILVQEMQGSGQEPIRIPLHEIGSERVAAKNKSNEKSITYDGSTLTNLCCSSIIFKLFKI